MTSPSLYQTPLRLFREGMDTLAIAEHLGCSEATAYNLIHKAREKQRRWRPIKFVGYDPRERQICP